MTALTAEAIRAVLRYGGPATLPRTAWICGIHRWHGCNEANAVASALAEAELRGWHVADTKAGIRLTPPRGRVPQKRDNRH
jgi:hypothetical protein